MYYGWKARFANGNNKASKYSLLVGGIPEIGVIEKNNSSLPLFCLGNSRAIAIRNFGRKKVSGSKIQNFLTGDGEIIIVGGPCLFSRSNLGILNSKKEFLSLAIPSERKNISENDIVSLKIGNPLTPYHELHLAYMEEMIKTIISVTGKVPTIRLLIPGVEYMAYISNLWPCGIKNEYWEKVCRGGAEVEKVYRNRLSPLGNLEIVRKKAWDVPMNGSPLSRDVSSYIKSYISNTEGKLIIAVEDIMDFPLIVEAGKRIDSLLGIMGVITPPRTALGKEEETHPYLS